MEMNPNEKLILKIRKDVETRPIEVNVQSTGVSEEEQVFFTEEGDETEEQIWERKKLSKKEHKVDDTVIQIDAISEIHVDESTSFTQKLRRTNQILLEQAGDPISLQLEANIQKEEHSEEVLQQEIQYKNYFNNLNRIVLKDEVMTQQYYNETGQSKYQQILLPKHLLKELLHALHGTANKHPGTSKLLQEVCKRTTTGCEPSKVIHKRISYNVVDHKLGNNPNKNFLPITEFAEAVQQRTPILMDQTKKKKHKKRLCSRT